MRLEVLTVTENTAVVEIGTVEKEKDAPLSEEVNEETDDGDAIMKSEALPRVAPVSLETVMVQVIGWLIRGGVEVEQNRIDASVGDSLTSKVCVPPEIS